MIVINGLTHRFHSSALLVLSPASFIYFFIHSIRLHSHGVYIRDMGLCYRSLGSSISNWDWQVAYNLVYLSQRFLLTPPPTIHAKMTPLSGFSRASIYSAQTQNFVRFNFFHIWSEAERGQYIILFMAVGRHFMFYFTRCHFGGNSVQPHEYTHSCHILVIFEQFRR